MPHSSSSGFHFTGRTLEQDIADQTHVTQLDGLRGLLALGVFFAHAQSYQIMWRSGRWGKSDSTFYGQFGIAPVAVSFLITGFL
jgi:peptidoglycan/LPS O-acetylase OafA/YrhL